MNRRKFIGTVTAFIGLCATAIGVKSKFAPIPVEEWRLVVFEYDRIFWANKADFLADAFAELDEIEAKSPTWRFIDGEWEMHEPTSEA